MTSTFRSGSSRRKAETPGKIRIQLKGKDSKVLNSDDEDDPVVDNVDIEEDDDDGDNLPVTFDSGIPDDLPEGTFIVQPEPVEDAPVKKKREAVVRIDTSVLDNVSCTACGRQVNPYKGGALQKHSTLKVVICKRCEKFLSSGEIAKDKDGTDEQCRWCGEGGRLVVCDECASAFCKACVMRNFNRSEFNNINGQQNWKCYLCHKAPLQGLRENYRKIRDTLKALQEKEKAKAVTLAANPTNNGTQPSEKSAEAKQISKSFPHNSAIKGWNVSGAVSAQKNPSSFEGVRTLTSSSLKSNSETSHKLPASGSIKNINLSLDDINVTFDNVFTIVDKLVMATNTFREMLHVLQSQSQFTLSGDIVNHALRVRCAKALNMGTETYLKSLKTILSGPPHMLENVAHRAYAPDIFPAVSSGIDSASSVSASETFALSRLSANSVIMPMGPDLSFQHNRGIVDPFIVQQSSPASTSAAMHMPEIKQEIIDGSFIDSNREKIQFVQEDSNFGKEKYSCISNSGSSKPNGKCFQNNFQLSKDKATKSITTHKEISKAPKDHIQSKTKGLEECNRNTVEDDGFEAMKEIHKDITQDEKRSKKSSTSSSKQQNNNVSTEDKTSKITGKYVKMTAREENVEIAAKKVSIGKNINSDNHKKTNQGSDEVIDNLSDKLAEKETASSSKGEKCDMTEELSDEMLIDKDRNNARDDSAGKFGEEINKSSDRLSSKDSQGMKSCQDDKKTKPEETLEEDSADVMAVDDNLSSSQILSDDDVDLATRRQKKKKEMLKPAEKTLMPTKRKQENSKMEEKVKTNGKQSTKSLLDNVTLNGKDGEDALDVAEESTKPSRPSLLRKRKASTLEKDEEELDKPIKKNSTTVNNPVKRLKPGPKSSKKGLDYDDQSSAEKEKRVNEDDVSDDEDEPQVTFCLTPAEFENQKDLNDDGIYVTNNGSLDNMESGDDASDNEKISNDEDSDAAKKVNIKTSKKIKKKDTKDKDDDGKDGKTSKRKKRNIKIPDPKSSDSESEIDEPKKKKKADDEDTFKVEESCSSSIESDITDSDEADGSDDLDGEENEGEPKSKKKGKSKARKKKKRKGKGKKGADDDDDEDEDSEEKDDGEEKEKKTEKGKGKRMMKKMNTSDEDEDPEGKEVEDDDDDDDEDDDDPNSSKAGKRKQIRKVMSNKRLEDSTKAAARAEEKRRKRIAAKQREFNIETITDENNPMNCPITTKLILEPGKEEGDEPVIQVNKNLVRKLKPHQVEAVQFMWDCMYESVKRAKKEQGSGCILAHCMGLGKTLSVISFVHTILTHEKVLKQRTCLVVSPLNTVLNWKSEWSMWLDEEDQLEVWELASCKQNAARAEALKEWQESGGIMIMGYEMYRNLTTGSRCKNKRQKKIFQDMLVNPGPDLVICDEGHILKNEASAISKAMNQMKTRRRVVLTGTPLQNNLNEYHCMLSFVKPSLLGTRKEFTNRFISPIQNGQCTDSTPRDVKIMKARAHVLHEMLAGCVQRRDYSALTKFLPPKQEYVISVRLANIQIELYEKYLEITGQGVDGVFSNKGARLFADYQNLMKIWTHPWVLKLAEIRDELKMKYDDEDSFIDEDSDEDRSFSSSSSSSEDDKGMSDNGGKASSAKANMQRGTRRTRAKARRQAGEDSDPEEVIAEWKSKTRTKPGDDVDVKSEEPDKSVTKEWWAQFVTEDDKLKLELSNKLYLLFEILRMCEEIGDKVLIFSQSILSLNIIESFLEVVDSKFQIECETLTEEEKEKEMFGRSWTKNLDYYRMDGSTSAQNRQLWASNFNDIENYRARLFLISTRAGGLGINLVAANRVIIFDASWNPSHDVQSIFRVYRFGQTKPCYIYRFLAQGTMEEKIYERQVTKLSLSQRVVDEHQIERHFSANDLKELYNFRADKWDDGTEKPTLALPKDPLLAEILTSNKHCVVSFHEHDSLLENQVEQTLTEEEKKAAWEEYENEKKGIIIRGPGMERTASWPMMAAAQILSREQITATVQALRQQLPDISEDLFHLHLQQALRRQVQIKQEEMRRMELLRLQEMNYLNMIKQQAQQSGLSHAQSLQAMQNMAPWMQIQRLRAMQQSMLMGGGHLGMLPSASMSLLGQALSNTISNKPEEAIDLDDN